MRLSGPILLVIGHGGHGGIERHVEALSHALRKRGVDVHLCVTMEEGEVSAGLASDGVPVHILNCRSGHDPRLLWRFPRLIKALSPAMVHFHELHLIPLLVLCFCRRVRVLDSEHCSLRQCPNLFLTRVIWILLGWRIQRIFPVSRDTAQQLASLIGIAQGRMRVIHNGIDVGQIQQRIKAYRQRRQPGNGRMKVIGGVGRLARQKDWDAFLETAQVLSQLRSDLRFVIVGDGPLRSELAAKAAALGLAERVTWYGFRDDAVELMSEFDVFLLTSLHEELPTTLLEAFAAGVPVAGFVPEGGVQEILDSAPGKVGRFVTERSPRLLADAVQVLLERRDEAKRMAARARTLVEQRFSMAGIAAELMSEYRRFGLAARGAFHASTL